MTEEYEDLVYSEKLTQNKYPDDEIKNVHSSLIEDFVFSSKNISDVKRKLLDYVNNGRGDRYNMTEATINNLFNAYE